MKWFYKMNVFISLLIASILTLCSSVAMATESLPLKAVSLATGQSLITWEEFRENTNLSDLCKDTISDRRYIQKDGCVFWSRDKNGDMHCLIFTKAGMSNDLFGKLIKHCYKFN